MGFTRTSEGRVFFKGPDNDDGPRFEAATSVPPEPVMGIDQTQMQILLLLKSLNTKLKSSKEEQAAMKKQLAAYRASLKQIRDKTGSFETNYIDLEQQVSKKQAEAQKQVSRVEDTLKDTMKQLEEARKLVADLESKAESGQDVLSSLKSAVDERKAEEEKILKKQKDLEKAQATQGEKMVDHLAAYVALTKRVSESEARQASLDNKIEENTSEFLKLDRKIDKAVEDRNRILRKIERIEAAVMETRDALNAKAMVLLTQQGASPQAVEYPQISETVTEAVALDDEGLWWKKSVRINPVSLAALILVVLMVGWLFSSLFAVTPTTPKSLKLKTDTMPYREGRADGLPAGEIRDSTQPLALKTEIDGSASSLIAPLSASNDLTMPTQVDLRDEAQTLAMMEDNPEKVAKELNKIEPSALPPPVVARDVMPEKIVEQPDVLISPEPVNTEPIAPEQVEKAEKVDLKESLKPDKNLTAVAKRIEAQAYDGVPEAQHDMGAIYVSGHGSIKQDMNRAVFWFEQAADNGVANAQYNLGVLYHQGLGVEKNLDQAIALYQKAADRGHPEAQYNLGIANIEGIGVPYNPQKAAMYFENAANKNIMEAAYNLGLIYENGLLGETHPDEALMWYKTASDNGSPEAKQALEQLANSLGIGLNDVKRVVEKTRATKEAGASRGQSSQQEITGDIQKELMARGLYPGPVDGMNGPMTANAIKTFQTSANIAADGIPSRDLLNYMRSSRN